MLTVSRTTLGTASFKTYGGRGSTRRPQLLPTGSSRTACKSHRDVSNMEMSINVSQETYRSGNDDRRATCDGYDQPSVIDTARTSR